MIRFRCPSCGTVLNAQPGREGRTSRCPRCREELIVPGPPPQVPAAPPPVPPDPFAGLSEPPPPPSVSVRVTAPRPSRLWAWLVGLPAALLLLTLTFVLVSPFLCCGGLIYLGLTSASRPPDRAPAGTAAADKSAFPGGPGWTDATKAGVLCGDVRVSARVVGVQKVLLVRIGGEGMSEGEHLVIEVSLTNTNNLRKIDYRSWQSGGLLEPDPQLTDDLGNRYRQIAFTFAVKGGIDSDASLRPDETVRDRLVFEKPIPAAKYLFIELPGKNIGAPSPARFRLPVPKDGP